MGSLGSASIKLGLDRSQFDSDLKKLQATDAGQIAYRIKLDTKDFERQAKALQGFIPNISVPVVLDATSFKNQIKKLEQQILPVKVELSPDIDGFKNKLRNVKLSNLIDSPQLKVSVEQKVDSKNSTEQIKQLQRIEKILENNAKKSGIVGKLRDGFLYGAGGSAGLRFGGGAQSSLKQNFGLDFAKLGKSSVNTLSIPVKFFTENEQLKTVFAKIGDDLGKSLKTSGYRFGDAIVASLEVNEGSIIDRINAFNKELFKPEELGKNIQQALNSSKSAVSDVFGALFSEDVLRKATEPYGRTLSAYRTQALKDRAIPLVQQKAAEISQTKPRNSASRAVNPETEEIFIVTGGYAGARGLSGKSLLSGQGRSSPGINKDIEGRNAAAIWVKNDDSDLPSESMKDPVKKAQALLTSIMKPVLRGFSKDAVEMAAQALAAIEINPKIKIKFVGESGGGFAAEEAAKILELMGAKDNVEYLGVGTPNLIGGLNAKGQKIISPDETLGAEASSLYTRFGLANTRKPSQQILGVEGHPYENYRNAEIAEVMNSLKGAPQRFNKEDIKHAKLAANSFKSEDLSKLDPKQLQGFARMAFANLQNVRRQILIASEDTKVELEEIAKVFEKVFINASPDTYGVGRARGVLAKAQKIYQALNEQRGTEAGQAAQQLLLELQTHQKEFQAAYKNTVGTTKAKVKSLDEMFQELIEKLSDPSLSVKGSTSKTKSLSIPTADSVSAIKNIGQTYSDRAKSLPNLQDAGASKQLATDISKSATEARIAINDLIAAFGASAPREVRKAAKTARQQITYAENKSKQYTGEGEEIGRDVGAGLDQGIQSAIALVRKSASDLANNLIDQTKDDLEIHSPSKVFEEIGRFISQGLAIGLDSTDAARDFTSGLVDESQKGASLISKAFTSLKGVIGGFLVVQALGYAQSLLSDLVKDATQAYIKIDKIKTSLDFASGSSAAGSRNLSFVKQQVEDLKIPLQASIEGFTKLESAARGSSLAGKDIRELFAGLSEASTVLSLSADETQGIANAISQSISKGKLLAEEQNQLAERIPGVFGIMSRAAGVTEAEFTRLRDSGQVLAQDFFPKFARQLRAEFGEAAKDAAGNAQSAIFNLENSFVSLQQAVGEATAPGAAGGMNLLADGLKLATKFGAELAIVFTSLNIALAAQSLPLFKDLLFTLFKTKSIPGIFSAIKTGAIEAGNALNNSFSAKVGLAVFGVLEIVNLLNQQVNTDLVKSFEKAAQAAQKAADASERAFEKNRNRGGKNTPTPTFEPQASSDIGRNVDNFLIKPLKSASKDPLSSSVLATIPLIGTPLSKVGGIKTTGEYERDENLRNFTNQVSSSAKLAATVSANFAELQKGVGGAGDFINIDKQLQQAEQQRRILQARIERDYSQKGLPVPIDITFELNQVNKNIAELNEQRGNLSKPYTDDLTRINRDINNLKASLKDLDTPEAIDNLGEDKIAQQKSEYEQKIQLLERVKAKSENIIAAMRVDPIRVFTQALRELNLTLAEGQEKNEQKLADRKLANTKQAIAGFSTNKLAARQLALTNADAEREITADNAAKQQAIVTGLETEVNKPEFQPTLQRLGVAPDSSAAKIDDVLKNTSDDADKGVLEKLKTFAESRLKLSQARQVADDAKQRLSQQVQDNSLFSIEDSAANSRAATQKAENQKIAAVKNAQTARLITEEVANEKLSRIQLQSTRSQQKSLDQQLTSLLIYHKQGAISAEKFAEKRRELEKEQTNLEKQEAENRLAVQQAVIQRRLKDIEFANKKAENAIALTQTTSTTGVKARLLASGIATSTKDSADLEQNSIDQKAAIDNTALIKTKITQNQQEYKEGRRSAREFAEQQMALNLELGKSHQQLIDLKIAAEEKYRAIVERGISTDKTIATTAIDKRLLAAGLTPEAQDQAAIDKNKVAQQEVVDKIKFIKSRVKDEKQAKDEIAALDSQLTTLKIEEEQKRRESVEHNIQRIMQAEENRFKKQISQFDESKAKLDLYNQSLERTNKLEQSRQSLSKALSDAAVIPAENQRTDADDAQSLVDKLKDPNVKRRTKRAAREQLRDMGYEVNSNTKPEEIELQIKEKRIEAENAIASIKQKALEMEQEFQHKSLENDLKRQKIAAQMLLYEAQSAQLAAQKAKNEAEGALKIAISKKDPLAIETAQTNLDIANKQIDLSNERVANAQANLNDQPEIAANATAEQKATQDAQNQSFEYGEKRRQRQGAIELVEAGEKARRPISLSSAEAKVESTNPQLALPQRININQMPKLDLKPGESIFDVYQRQREGMKLPSESAKFPTSIKADIPPMDKTAAAINSASIQPRDTSSGNQFAESLKMANQGIEKQLAVLSDRILQLANTPRSLTVQTPNAVDDAAKLMNDLSRGQVVGAGL
ncbi:MAG: tape measure protein [Desmonostoc geniculatum HA4340-LM1]|jgi:tape measure domain-containing protein|nr:tape measure protein [Desmonostoc geniculatum HA4340-LM1]